MNRRIQNIRHDLQSLFFKPPKIMIALTLVSICRSFFIIILFFFYIPALLNISPPLKFSLSLSISIRYILELFSRHTMIIRRSASMMMVVLHLIISLFMQIIFSIFHSSLRSSSKRNLFPIHSVVLLFFSSYLSRFRVLSRS